MKLSYKVHFQIIIQLLVAGVLFSQDDVNDTLYSVDKDGDITSVRYANELNHISLGCRVHALGNTGVVLPYTPFSVNWNPSLISFSNDYRLDIEGTKLFGGISSLGAIAIEAPVQEMLNVGLSYTAFFSDAITMYDTLSSSVKKNAPLDGYESIGTMKNNKNRVVATVAKRFRIPFPRPAGFSAPLPVDFGIGLNAKILWETMDIGNSVRMGMNINIDAGFLLRIGVDYDLSQMSLRREIILGLSFCDFLPTTKTWLYSYQQYEETIDAYQHFGLAYIDRSGFLMADWTITLAIKRSYEATMHAGIEAKFLDVVAFRVGIADKIATLGTGITYRRYLLDYSFSFDELSWSVLRLAIGVSF